VADKAARQKHLEQAVAAHEGATHKVAQLRSKVIDAYASTVEAKSAYDQANAKTEETRKVWDARIQARDAEYQTYIQALRQNVFLQNIHHIQDEQGFVDTARDAVFPRHNPAEGGARHAWERAKAESEPLKTKYDQCASQLAELQELLKEAEKDAIDCNKALNQSRRFLNL
jgi:hypothetical protein